MSRQSVLAFITRVNGDPAIQAQIKNLSDLQALIAFAEKADFRFAAGELSIKELEQVAGGGIEPTPFMGWGSRFLSPRITIIQPCF